MGSYEYMIDNLRNKGTSQGYLTYDEINDALPRGHIPADQIEDIIAALVDSNINLITKDIEPEFTPQSNSTTTAQSEPVKRAGSNIINTLMDTIFRKEHQFQQTLFKLPSTVSMLMHIIHKKETDDHLLLKKLNNVYRDYRKALSLFDNVEHSSLKQKEAETRARMEVENIIKYAWQLGLSRGDVNQIWYSVNHSFEELKEIASSKKENSKIRRRRLKLQSDLASPLQNLEELIEIIGREQNEINALRENIFRVYAPIIRRLASNNLSHTQEGLLGLLKAYDEYPYNNKHGFSAFAERAIKNATRKEADDNNESEPANLVAFQEIGIGNEKKNIDEVLDASSGEWESEKEPTEMAIESKEETDDTSMPSQLQEIVQPVNLNIPILDTVTPDLVEDATESLIQSKPIRPRISREVVKSKDISELLVLSDDGAVDYKGEESQKEKPIISGTRIRGGRKMSAIAGIVGKRAEAAVIKHLMETLSEDEVISLCWVSREGITPGWDIEYITSSGEPIKIEVKGTTGSAFTNIEISGNEWHAAEEQGKHFWLYVVTECFSENPQIGKINDPYAMAKSGIINATPLLWRLEWNRIEN